MIYHLVIYHAIEVFTLSPERINPTCPHFRACGGCQYQHLDYTTQVRWKQKQVAEILARDLMQLAKSGYRLVRVQPFDMFPQTARIEWLAELDLMI